MLRLYSNSGTANCTDILNCTLGQWFGSTWFGKQEGECKGECKENSKNPSSAESQSYLGEPCKAPGRK